MNKTEIENTIENRNELKAKWINEQAAGCAEWKEHCRQWQEMELNKPTTEGSENAEQEAENITE